MNHDDFDKYGLAIEPVRGIRSFNITASGWLSGIVYKQDWTPGENLAHCYKYNYDTNRNLQPRNQPNTRTRHYWWGHGNYDINTEPHDFETCRHGFYGYYDGSNNYGEYGDAMACVEGYGLVMVGSRGFRATKARIIGICFKTDISLVLVDKVLDRYPNVGVTGSFEQLVAQFPPTGDQPETIPND